MQRPSLTLLDGALQVLFAVVAQERGLAVDDGVDLDWTLPYALERAEHLARVVDLEVEALVVVLEQQLATVFVVGVRDVDEGLARVGEREEDLLLHLLELAGLDLPAIALFVVAKGVELLRYHELFRQILVDERDVVVVAPDLEDLLHALAGAAVP